MLISNIWYADNCALSLIKIWSFSNFWHVFCQEMMYYINDDSTISNDKHKWQGNMPEWLAQPSHLLDFIFGSFHIDASPWSPFFWVMVRHVSLAIHTLGFHFIDFSMKLRQARLYVWPGGISWKLHYVGIIQLSLSLSP